MSANSHITLESSRLGDSRRIWIQRALKVSLTVLVLGLLTFQVSWSEVFTVLSKANVFGVVAALVLWLPNQWLQFMRWKMIAERATTCPSPTDIKQSYWLGHTLGFLTPGRVGAYGRGLFLSNVKLGEATALTVLERSYSAIIVNGFGLIALAVLPEFGWHVSWATWSGGTSVVLFVVGSFILILGIFPGKIVVFVQGLVKRLSWASGISRTMNTLVSLGYKSSLLYLSMAAAALLVSLTQFLLILDALGCAIPIVAGLLAVHLNFFLKGNIPLTLGNLGIGEWTALLCLRGLGVPDATAIAASLILFSINVAVPAVIGARYVKRLFSVHRDWHKRV